MDDDDSTRGRAPARRGAAAGGRHDTGAMPEDHNAIRIGFDADDPPALLFNEQALPGALVSWAWCQLAALDALLRSVVERREGADDPADVVGAVRSLLVPAINALEFSERRAYQIACGRSPASRRRRRKKRKGIARK